MVEHYDQHVEDWRQRLYAPIGRTLSRWASLESTLCNLYCVCINHENGCPANHAFWAMVSFETKLAATNAVAETVTRIYPPLAKEWNAIHNRLIKKNRNRNRIAHGSVITMSWKNRDGSLESDNFLAPYYYKYRDKHMPSLEERQGPDYDNRPKDRMYTKEIGEVLESIRGAERRLRTFISELRKAFEARDHPP